MTHIMLDLETMGTAPNAAIVAIGAVCMTNTGKVCSEPFYRPVDLQTSLDAGLRADGDTVLWWMQQGAAARAAICAEDRATLTAALCMFRDWLPTSSAISGVWGNGAASDNVWIDSAFRAVRLHKPWSYRQDRCYRTFCRMHRDVPEPPENRDAHNALSDAIWQAAYLEAICAAKNVRLA